MNPCSTVRWVCLVALAAVGNAMSLPAAELARFEITKPPGQTWTDEWLTQELDLDIGAGANFQIAVVRNIPAAGLPRADQMKPLAEVSWPVPSHRINRSGF